MAHRPRNYEIFIAFAIICVLSVAGLSHWQKYRPIKVTLTPIPIKKNLVPIHIKKNFDLSKAKDYLGRSYSESLRECTYTIISPFPKNRRRKISNNFKTFSGQSQ